MRNKIKKKKKKKKLYNKYYCWLKGKIKRKRIINITAYINASELKLVDYYLMKILS